MPYKDQLGTYMSDLEQNGSWAIAHSRPRRGSWLTQQGSEPSMASPPSVEATPPSQSNDMNLRQGSAMSPGIGGKKGFAYVL